MKTCESNENYHKNKSEEISKRAHIEDEDISIWIINEFSPHFPIRGSENN